MSVFGCLGMLVCLVCRNDSGLAGMRGCGQSVNFLEIAIPAPTLKYE